MTKFKVFFVEDKTTANGTTLKKLTLEQAGKQYPIKGVTMWSDHPLFTTIAAGQEIEGFIREEDSGNPNPKAPGKNYINRTLVTEQVAAQAAPSSKEFAVGNAEIKNILQLEVMPALKSIIAWQERQSPINKTAPHNSDPDAIDRAFDSSPF